MDNDVGLNKNVIFDKNMKKKKRISPKRRVSNFGFFIIVFFISLFVLMGAVAYCVFKVQRDGGMGSQDKTCSESIERNSEDY